MSYHIISVDSLSCELTVSKGQLIFNDASGTKQVPMEDVASIIVTSFKANFTNAFFISAAEHRVPVVICHHYTPVSVLLPADRTTDTLLLRNLATLKNRTKDKLWQMTLSAKCLNQYILAKQWAPKHPLLGLMYRLATQGHSYREGETAKYFWGIFGEKYAPDDFRRGRYLGSYNPLFNYAYAILLSTILRYLYAYGVEPTFGIHHMARAHATPLAYDLMEPFRPAFDANVARWIEKNPDFHSSPDSDTLVTREYKAHISRTLLAATIYSSEKQEITIRNCIDRVIRSFKAAVVNGNPELYQPWILKNIKWDG